jgi:uncharacterized protein YutE (UPF0331/DUF86 family)
MVDPDVVTRRLLALNERTLATGRGRELHRPRAGLRNVLVNDYVSVDLRTLAKVVREDLGDLRAFGSVI